MDLEKLAQYVPYILITIWVVFAIIYYIRFFKVNDTQKINVHLFNSIPSVFTTLGVFGTFLGVFVGLLKFDQKHIADSIPKLLEGLKMAFLTSILGIVLSLIFKIIGQNILKRAEKNTIYNENELSALNQITEILKQINNSLVGNIDTSISTQLVKLRNSVEDSNSSQTKILNKVQSSLTGDDETSLSTQLANLRGQFTDAYNEQKESNKILNDVKNSIVSDKNSLSSQLQDLNKQFAETQKKQKESKEVLNKIKDSILSNNKSNLSYHIQEFRKEQNKNSTSLRDKFDEFGEILKKNNTEALVDVMKKSTEVFNTQMSELIERLVKENFNELNNSVQNLNTWQQENKEMISTLTQQFTKVADDFMTSAISLEEITANTTKLTNENSHLSKLIQELQKVMIDDTNFTKITEKLTETINTLKENTDTFDETTNKLNDWIINERNFRDSVDILIARLEEIEKIKDINGEFWEQTKKQLNEGVGLITNASNQLRSNLDDISEEFIGQLNETLTSLDALIQRLIVKNGGSATIPRQKISPKITNYEEPDDLPF